MWNDMCGCIDENWKALKARIQASITGITVNGTTHYQTDGTGICDLGDIGGNDDAIVSIKGTALGHVQSLELTEADGTKTTQPITQYTGTDFDVTYDEDTSTTQVSIAQTVKDTIDGAVDAGVTAQTDAANAQTTANAAYNGYTVSRYLDGETEELGIDFTNANGSHDTKMLFDAGQGIEIDAGTNPTVKLTDAIVSKINRAFKGMSIGDTDGQLILSMYDQEETPSEIPIFKAGTNLTLEADDTGYVLNAEGGSGSNPVTVTTFSEYLSGTPAVGDVVIIRSSSGMQRSITTPYKFNITTGTYGADMQPISGSSTSTPQSLITCNVRIGFVVYEVTDTGISGYLLFVSGSHGDISTTISNGSISVDGADAITATMNIVSNANEPYSAGNSDTIYLSKSSTSTNISVSTRGKATYDGISADIRFYTNAYIISTAKTFVMKGQA